MNAHLQDHGCGLRAVIENLITRTNLHRMPRGPARTEPDVG
jgi:hypothetical protein